MVTNAATVSKAPGLTIGAKLILTFLAFIIALGVSLTLVYRFYVPKLIIEQIDLRAYSIIQSFGAAVLEPTLVKNYLRVNKVTETTTKLPGVAYAAVIDAQGVLIAGLFADSKKFGSELAVQVSEKGFPQQLLGEKRARSGGAGDRRTLQLGGQNLYEIALPLESSGAEIRVALFTDEVERAVQATLTPLALLLLVIAVLGSMVLFLVARTVSNPIRRLTQQADLISTGRVDAPITIEGTGEIWELASAFSRMQTSIKYMMEQMDSDKS